MMTFFEGYGAGLATMLVPCFLAYFLLHRLMAKNPQKLMHLGFQMAKKMGQKNDRTSAASDTTRANAQLSSDDSATNHNTYQPTEPGPIWGFDKRW